MATAMHSYYFKEYIFVHRFVFLSYASFNHSCRALPLVSTHVGLHTWIIILTINLRDGHPALSNARWLLSRLDVNFKPEQFVVERLVPPNVR
jgi:hypothetical protein